MTRAAAVAGQVGGAGTLMTVQRSIQLSLGPGQVGVARRSRDEHQDITCQFSDALGVDLEATQQGGIGGALAIWDGRSRGGSGPITAPFDFGAQVGLAVEPGPGRVDAVVKDYPELIIGSPRRGRSLAARASLSRTLGS